MKKAIINHLQRAVAIVLLAAVSLVAHAESITVGDFVYDIKTAASSSSVGRLWVTGLSTTGASKTTITVPYMVTSGDYTYCVERIATGAFQGNTTLTGATITYGLTRVNGRAFQNCTALTYVRIPSSVAAVGAYAFAGCTSLARVYYSSMTPSLTTDDATAFPSSSSCELCIPKGASVTNFRAKSAFATTYFPTVTVTSNASDYLMSNGAHLVVTKASSSTSEDHECAIVGFSNSGTTTNAQNGILYLSSYHIKPNGQDRYFKYTSVADSAFAGNAYLKGVDLSRGTGITTYGRYSMSNCANLTSVSLAGGAVQPYAMYNDVALTTLSLGSVTSIDSYALGNCTSLTSVTIPASTTFVNVLFDQGCTSLKSISVSSGNTVYSSYNSSIYSKDYTELKKVPYGYEGEYGEFPSTCTSIGMNAFVGMPSLTSVIIPYGVTKLQYGTFATCTALSRLEIPSSVTQIATNAMFNSSALTELYINMPTPATYTSTLLNITPSKVRLYVPRGKVTDYKTAGWTGFKSYNNNDVVSCDAYINNIAYDVYDTTSTTIDDVTYDGQCQIVRGRLAANVSGTINIPNSITLCGKSFGVDMIDKNAFNTTNTFALTGCGLVKKVWGTAFRGQKITSITLPRIEHLYDSTFYNCTALTNVKWGNDLKTVGHRAFYNAPITNDIILPVGVKFIGYEAFAGVKSKLILVPHTVSAIFKNSFVKMSSLETLISNRRIYYNNETMDFDGTPSTCKLYIPYGLIDNAKKSTWNHFETIIEGSFDFATNGATNMLNKRIKMTVTSTDPVTVDGVTYDGTAAYVHNDKLDDYTYFTTNLAETDQMLDGTPKKYLMTRLDYGFMANTTNVNSIDLTRMKYLESIGSFAFNGSMIESIELPTREQVTIGKEAFTDAPNLYEVVTKGPIDFSDRIFGNNAENFNFYVPFYNVYSLNEKYFKNYSFNDDELCSQHVAPCFTADAATFALGATVPLDLASQSLTGYAVMGNQYDESTRTFKGKRVDNVPHGNGVILTGLTPGTLYKVPQWRGDSATVMVPDKSNSLTAKFIGGKLDNNAKACIWDIEKEKFDRNLVVTRTLSSGNCFLEVNGASGSYYLDFSDDEAVLGDINGDGIVDITDVNMVINMVLGKLDKTSAADVDSSGDFDITDVNSVINIMLGK